MPSRTPKTLTRIDLPPLGADEERLVAAIRGHEHLHESDIRDYLLFVRARQEATDTAAKREYPTWPEIEKKKEGMA